MKYYENQIYPIGLVVAEIGKLESVREYFLDGNGKEISIIDDCDACTMLLHKRKDSAFCNTPIGIFFNEKRTGISTISHEAFHATKYMLDMIGIPLSDYSEEAWAYLIGWIASCIDLVKKEESEKFDND